MVRHVVECSEGRVETVYVEDMGDDLFLLCQTPFESGPEAKFAVTPETYAAIGRAMGLEVSVKAEAVAA
jgi:hypothetical protein